MGYPRPAEQLVVPRSKMVAEGRKKIGDNYNTMWGDSSAVADEAEMIATVQNSNTSQILTIEIQPPTPRSPTPSTPQSPIVTSQLEKQLLRNSVQVAKQT
ncbi:Hypothetical predicted protein [Mytilus galloprovincialis]|uniref:Uncharacterized protein n=1 Tax=Mytilus galloprovincialis TaxID=29158 RepID=A0A8B6DZU8_MYTGA|nr:Hypothetical predicted protein [Mytilus galloprovincialis]